MSKRLSTSGSKGPDRETLYAVATVRDNSDDRRSEVTLWHDGRVGFEIRVDGHQVFALSYYPSDFRGLTDELETLAKTDRAAVVIDRGEDLIYERE